MIPQASGGSEKAAPRPKEKILSMQEVQQRIINLPDWTLSKDGKSIVREIQAKDFSAAVELISKIAPLAEAADHHPDIHLTGYRLLKLELSTHSAGGLTDKDFMLASEIDALPKQLKTS
jgi:4a-hydroxytetrahydrobiopterin dehydratase